MTAHIEWKKHSERPWKGISYLVLDEAGVYCDAAGVVHVPYRNLDGSVHREHLFAADGRTWWTPGDGLVPLGIELLPGPETARRSVLIISEGDSDALSIREAFAATTSSNPMAGYYVLGLPGAATWRSEWRHYAEPFDRVYVIGDGDRAGRRMIDLVCQDVPWARRVILPTGSDARSLLQDDGPRALDPHLDRADRRAQLWAAWRVSPTLADAEALLRGEEVRPVAA